MEKVSVNMLTSAEKEWSQLSAQTDRQTDALFFFYLVFYLLYAKRPYPRVQGEKEHYLGSDLGFPA